MPLFGSYPFGPDSEIVTTPSRLVDARMLPMLARDFFPSQCMILEATESQDEMGGVVQAWTPVSGMEAIPCRMISTSGDEQQTDNQTYLDATYRIVLAGRYAIMELMRAVVGLVEYEIVVIEPDSEGIMTRLLVRLVR